MKTFDLSWFFKTNLFHFNEKQNVLGKSVNENLTEINSFFFLSTG